MRILLINNKDNFISQMAAAWLQSFDNDIISIATCIDTNITLDPIAVDAMKEVNITLSDVNIEQYNTCLFANWDYILVINYCIDLNNPLFVGNVFKWENLELTIPDTLNMVDDSIQDYYKSIRDTIKYQLLKFYLTTINNKEILGSDSCGVQCDLY